MLLNQSEETENREPPWSPWLPIMQANVKSLTGATLTFTKFEVHVLLQLIQLLRQFPQHGAQEGDVLVLLRQGQLHLVKPLHSENTQN